MRARAHLTVERDAAGRDVVRDLRSSAPLTLVPARTNGSALVHLVSSAATPLGGDDLTLEVHIGPSAELTLKGVAATVALPGRRPGALSRTTVHFVLAAGAKLTYLPESTVITSRAHHQATLMATLSGTARLHTREMLVLGRAGEPPGTLTTRTDITRDGRPVLRQHLHIGDPDLDASLASLAGHRVLATDLVVDDSHPHPTSGEWWSSTPLAAGGTMTTALAHDAVTALRLLSTAAQSAG